MPRYTLKAQASRTHCLLLPLKLELDGALSGIQKML